MHAEALLDGDQVAVVVAEQGAEQIGLLELELEAGAVGNGGEVAAGHQAATFVQQRAGHAVRAGGDKRHVDDVAERGVVSTCTD